ncbi:MAG: DNA recombination protein RmuC [Acidobacteriota bacterium]
MLTLFASLTAFLVGLLIGLAAWQRSRSRAGRHRAVLEVRLATLAKERQGDAEKLGWVEKAEEKMREAFKALASDVLKSNSETLSAHARRDLLGVVDPLKKDLASLDGHVRELEKARAGAYKSLEQQLSQLHQAHTQLQDTTTTLAQALQSPTVRGRWGELQLRRVVELAGMVKHVDFDEQAVTDQGRPDMIVHLPHGGVLPVDAKVPLDAYLAAAESSDEASRRRHLEGHARAMRSRVKELGQKQYWEQFEASPHFVVMFVPNEACFSAAFEFDPELLEYAIGKNVLVSSPVNLLALLRAVAYGWQQNQVAENALRIAQQGRDLYGRLETFTRRFAEVGEALGKSVDRYNRAVGSYDRRLVPAARRFQELGLGHGELPAPTQVELAPSPPSAAGGGPQEDRAPGEPPGPPVTLPPGGSRS